MRIRSALLGMIGLAGIAACGDPGDLSDIPEPIDTDESALAPLVAEPADYVTLTPWTVLGNGVSHKALTDNGTSVLLVYGGYRAEDEWVRRWAHALYRVKGEARGIGHLYAIRGPNQSGYQNREIANSKIATHLGQGRAALASEILVVAHSSGTYVADELLGQLRSGTGGVPAGTLGKVKLFNLDGGGVSSPSTLAQLNRAFFVYACDGAIHRCSRNAGAMQSLGDQYEPAGGAFEVDATNSKCSKTSSGGLWCLHDTLINTRPFNPDMYDLRNDYTNFTGGRSVVTAYLDAQ